MQGVFQNFESITFSYPKEAIIGLGNSWVAIVLASITTMTITYLRFCCAFSNLETCNCVTLNYKEKKNFAL